MPQLAQYIKAVGQARSASTSTSIVETPTKYYGSAVYGTSDWLDGEMSMVRLRCPLDAEPVPRGAVADAQRQDRRRRLERRPLQQPDLRQALQAVRRRHDLSSQRAIAKQIETLLLDETPIIYPYFYNYLSATQKNVTGVYPTALSQFFLWNATKS